jgi:membrane associated rhomboid family serine protease
MFLPIGDTPNPRNYTAWTNWLIIGCNVAVYLLITLPLSAKPVNLDDPLLVEYLKLLAELHGGAVDIRSLVANVSAYDLFTFVHGYKPAEPEIGDLFFSLFLHGGFAHLGGNMLFLWIFGDNVEHRLGHLGYLVVYLATGVAATLVFAFFAGQSKLPLVGASGAISGVLGLYFLLFARNRVKVLVVLFPFYFDVWLVPVRWVLGVYVLVDNLLPFVVGSESSVAYGAHLGGFFAGLGIAYLGERHSWKAPWNTYSEASQRQSAFPQTAPPPEDETLDALMRAVERGDRHQAMVLLGAIDRRDMARLAPRECAVLADWLLQQNMESTANRLLRQCIAAHPRSQDLAKVYLALGLLSLERGQPTAAYQHLQTVFDFNPDKETEARTRAALATIDVYRKRLN